jgi:NADPH:quinone reductase-like Zn-dependent oxidoreductase
MKAIAYYASLPINDPNALQDIELPAPVAGPRDVLVEVKAISVNPVDTKVRQNVAPENGAAKVLGWDVAGVVKAVGSDVTLFKVGARCFTRVPWCVRAATANCTRWMSASSGICRRAWVLPKPPRCR